MVCIRNSLQIGHSRLEINHVKGYSTQALKKSEEVILILDKVDLRAKNTKDKNIQYTITKG